MTLSLLKTFLPFIGFAAAILGLGHLYVFGRLLHYFAPSPRGRRMIVWAGVAFYVVTMTAMMLRRHGTMSALSWFGYTWMGMLLLFGVGFAAADILSLFARAAEKTGQVSEDRRGFIRKALGTGAIIAGAVMTGTALWNNGLRRVEVKPLTVRLKKWPKALDGFRIAQITDLHVGPIITGAWLSRIVDQVNALNADIIVITGDLVDGKVDKMKDQVASIARLQAKHGVYYVTGNHEYFYDAGEWVEHVRSLGIRTLVNERVAISAGGAQFDLVGIEDASAYKYDGHGANLGKALQGRNKEHAAVLLAHQPVQVIESAALGVDLQLSGHTHGGQIWPFGYTVLMQQPYIKGLHKHPGSDTQVYVSCGTGFWGPPMRFCAPAEITEITIRPV